MTKKLKVQTRQVISVQDWDSMVTSTYGKPYSFQQQDGCKERGSHQLTVPEDTYDYENRVIPDEINGDEMGVNFKDWLERDPLEWNGDPEDSNFVSLFWERNFYPDVQILANDLYDKGLIEDGKYYIEIDW